MLALMTAISLTLVSHADPVAQTPTKRGSSLGRPSLVSFDGNPLPGSIALRFQALLPGTSRRRARDLGPWNGTLFAALVALPGAVRTARLMAVADYDSIQFQNKTGSDDAAVVVDGVTDDGEFMDDVVYIGNTVFQLPNLVPPTGKYHSEVAVFTRENAMQLIETDSAWTEAAGDKLTVSLTPLLKIPVKVWIVQGPYGDAKKAAKAEVKLANAIYSYAMTGIQFEASYQDVTQGNADQGSDCNTLNDLKALGYDDTVINVYYNALVDTGWSCTTKHDAFAAIVIGTEREPETLAHELGHALSLEHVKGVPGFSEDNIMWEGGSERWEITLGQGFRCNVNSSSVINTLGTRTGITRSCPPYSWSRDCPELTLHN